MFVLAVSAAGLSSQNIYYYQLLGARASTKPSFGCHILLFHVQSKLTPVDLVSSLPSQLSVALYSAFYKKE